MQLSTYLLKLAKQEIETTKCAALRLMSAVLRNTGAWGLEQLLSNSDLLTYLEDSTFECTKAGREWKFDAIDAICTNSSREFLGEKLHRLEILRQRGPFYQSSQLAGPMTM
jgi:hypothetical protein